MNCQQFSQRLDELLDDRRDPVGDGPLLQHARRCLDCRQYLEVQLAILGELARTRGPHPAAHRVSADTDSAFAPTTFAGVAGERRHAGRRTWALALSALIGVAVAVHASKPLDFAARQLEPSAARVASSTARGPAIRTGSRPLTSPADVSARMSASGAAASKPQLNRHSASVESAVANLGLTATDEPSGRDRSVRADRGANATDDLADWSRDWTGWLAATDRWARRESTWLQPVRGGLGPLAGSMSRAFNVLRLSWPAAREVRSRLIFEREARHDEVGASS